MNASSKDSRIDRLPEPVPDARRATIVAAAFFLFIGAVPLWDQFGGKASRHHPPTVGPTAQTLFVDGSFARRVETRLLQESVLREPLLPPWSLFLYSVASETPPELRVGRDGWLFLSKRLDVPTARQREVIGSLVERMSALHLRLKSIGIRLVLLPMPTKAWIHPGQMPAGSADTSSFHRELLAALDSQGVEAIDFAWALRRFGDAESGFCRTDSHWNWKGALAAAEAIADRASLRVAEADRTTSLHIVARFPDVGDLARMIGFDALLHRSPKLLAGLRRLGFPFGEQVAYTVHLKSGQPASPAPWQGNGNAPLLVAGTSFSAWPEFDRYLQHATGGRTRLIATRGGGLCTSLLAALRQILASPTEFPPPSTIVLEFPVANVWSEERPWDDFGSLFALLPAPHLQALTTVPITDARGSLQPGTVKLQSARQTMQMNNREVHHEGYGHVSLRLRGTVKLGTPLVMLTYGGDSVFALWEAHQSELILPLPSSEAIGTVEISLSAPAGAAELTLKSIERVVHSRTQRWSFDATNPTAREEFSTLIALNPTVNAPPHGALIIEAQGISKTGQGFEVQFLNNGQILTSMSRPAIGEDPCAWLLPFALPANAELTHLRIIWTGGTPKSFNVALAPN